MTETSEIAGVRHKLVVTDAQVAALIKAGIITRPTVLRDDGYALRDDGNLAQINTFLAGIDLIHDEGDDR